jgi:integrase
MLPDHLSRVSVKLFRAQDFPKGFTFHGLRHTHASYLIASGVPIKVISERLGHSSIAMTMDIYGHLLDGQDEAASDAFDQALKAASCKNVSPQFGPKDTVASQQK